VVCKETTMKKLRPGINDPLDVFERLDLALEGEGFRTRHQKVVALKALLSGQENLEKAEDVRIHDDVLSGAS
jgi:hypothetical protein